MQVLKYEPNVVGYEQFKKYASSAGMQHISIENDQGTVLFPRMTRKQGYERIKQLISKNDNFVVVEYVCIPANEEKNKKEVYKKIARHVFEKPKSGGLAGLDFEKVNSNNIEHILKINNLEQEIVRKDEKYRDLSERYNELKDYAKKQEDEREKLEQAFKEKQAQASVMNGIATTLGGALQIPAVQNILSGLSGMPFTPPQLEAPPEASQPQIPEHILNDHYGMENLRQTFGANYPNLITVVKKLAQKQAEITQIMAYLDSKQ